MTRKGWITATLFSALCLGGILVLFEQSGSHPAGAVPLRSMDPSVPDGRALRDAVPRAIERSALLRHRERAEPAGTAPGKGPAAPKKLTLR